MLFETKPKQVIEKEVVVIGGGIVGLATAFYLAQAGKQVAVLDRRPFGWEGTGRSAGGVRQRGRDPRERAMAMLSVRLWQGLDEELGAPTHYQRAGNISVALNEAELAILSQEAERERAGGLDVEVIGQKELQELVPALSDRCIGGSFCPTDGYAEPAAVVSAFVNGVQRAGGELFAETEVLDFKVEGRRISSILTAETEFRPQVTVNAAGPWSNTLTMRVGLSIPVWPGRAQLVCTEPVGPLFKEFLIFEGERVYCRPTMDGSIHFGSITKVKPTDVTAPATLTPASERATGLASVIPALAGVKSAHAWSGLLDITPDGVPILGQVGALDDYILATGFNGHGFCLGPAVGKLLAELITEGRPSLSLEAFSLSRFAASN